MGIMEKRTQAELRKDKFTRQAKIARDLADLALKEIDEAIDGHTGFINYEHVIGRAIARHEIDANEAYQALDAYERWILSGHSDLVPITDDDTLASPLGYLAGDDSILD